MRSPCKAPSEQLLIKATRVKPGRQWSSGTAKNKQMHKIIFKNKSPLDSRENKPVHPKGNQPWIFTGRTHAEAEAPILWPLDAKRWLTEKDPDAGKDCGQEKKRAAEDEMAR